MNKTEMEYFLALFELGLVENEDIVKCSNSLIDSGIVSESLIELISLNYLYRVDLDKLFRKAMAELDIAIPSEEQATWKYIEYQLKRTVNGEVSIDEIYWNLKNLRDDIFKEDTYNLSGMISLKFQIDDWEGPPRERVIMKDELIRAAKNWLEQYQLTKTKKHSTET